MDDKKFKILGVILGSLLIVTYILNIYARNSISSVLFNIIYLADLAVGLLFLLPYAVKRIKKMTMTEWLIILFLLIFYGILIYRTTVLN